MSRFVAQHPFLIGAVLVSGPLAYCVATALLAWWTEGTRNLALPLVFIGLWLAYMGWWTYALFSFARSERRPRVPLSAPRHRFGDRFSHFDPHSN
jgi:hypothetical protein